MLLRLRSLVIPAVLVVLLAGCSPQSSAPDSTQTPGAAATATETPPSDAPSATPTVAPIALPSECAALVSIDTIHAEFSPMMVSETFVLHPEGEVGQSFADRNGLNCSWILPNSGGFVTMHVAERATDSDATQIAQWQSAGFADCGPLFDACFSHEEETMVGMMANAYVLLDGYELRVRTSAGGLDAMLALIREGATNMGHL